MSGRNSPQANQNLSKSLESHLDFSLKLKDLSDNDQIKNLVTNWVSCFNSLGKVYTFNVSGTFNTLSKLRIFGKKWQKEDQGNFKSLIVKLVQQGNTIDSKEFNSQAIANTLNALSKWDVLDSDVWDGKVTIDGKPDGDVKQFKTLIVKLVDQGIQSSTQFNSQQLSTNHTIYTRPYVTLTLSTLSIFINDMLDLFTNICNNQIISLTI